MPRRKVVKVELRAALDRANGTLAARPVYALPGSLHGIAIGPVGYREPPATMEIEAIDRANAIGWVRVADRLVWLRSEDFPFVAHLFSLTRTAEADQAEAIQRQQAKSSRKTRR